MAHIAAHASSRIESIDLTRCTSISDNGFQQWSIHNFPNLRKLILADCTYLTDQAIVGVANAARGLRELDLVSFDISSKPPTKTNNSTSHSAAPCQTPQPKFSRSV